jgi:cytoskeletal protein CcmA (bactofilin family)
MALFGSKKEGGEGKAPQAPSGPGKSPSGAAGVPTAAGSEQTKKRTAEPLGKGPGPGRNTGGGSAPPRRGDAVASIGKSIVFKGELTGSEDLEVDGKMEGDIKLPDHVLTIGPNGEVKASVDAKCVQVIGHITGNVTATERVEVQASGIVEGDISAPKLLIQEGAVVNGAIQMTGQAGARPVERPTQSTSTNSSESERKAG